MPFYALKVTPTAKFVLELVGLGLIPTKVACQYAEDPDSIFVHKILLHVVYFRRDCV